MHIFSIFFHPDPSVTAVGGAEKRFIETVKFFCKHDVKITLIEPQPCLLAKFSDCPRIYGLFSFNTFAGKGWVSIYFSWVLWIVKACLCSLRVINRDRFDVILAPNNTLPNLFLAYFVHLVSRLPVCAIVHHVDVFSSANTSNFSAIYNTYRKIGYERITSLIKTLAFTITFLILRRVDTCITVSNTTAKFLMENGVSEKRIRVSGNGVRWENIVNKKGKKNSPHKFYDGVFVGRIAKEKGVYDLIQAWQRIVQVKKDSKLVMIGTGPLEKDVKKKIKKFKLDNNIELVGYRDGEGKYEIFKQSKIVVHPATYDSGGMSAAEIMAWKLPGVSFDLEALKTYYPKGMAKIPFGNFEGFVKEILKLLSDKNYYQKVAEEARDLVIEEWDWNKRADMIFDKVFAK
ncbi:MAG: glycosyltransferase family 4 protein [Candidatus Omnitrophica bacterium]|nr:glycosyltransferase family 4 protein [Candidatus Omnitrophota bacterium]